MAKQTSSRPAAKSTKSKPSEAPGPITKTVAKPSETLSDAKPPETLAGASRPAPSHDAIASRAYQLYLTRSHADGSADNDWFRAERELVG